MINEVVINEGRGVENEEELPMKERKSRKKVACESEGKRAKNGSSIEEQDWREGERE